MKISTRRHLTLTIGVSTLLLVASVPVAAQSDSSDESDSAAYCESVGGIVVDRRATLNTNADSSQWIPLGESLQTCMFTSGEGESQTQISVDLHTLYSEEPTLAGLAYLSAVPSSNSGPAGSNPASSYCPDDLGGTEQFGSAGPGGAWVIKDPGMDLDWLVLSFCVFADRSAIDDFGLFYAGAGEVRGIDLSTVMRYQPGEDLPDVFASSEGGTSEGG